jgi:Protein of unknown function (DUF2716)
MNNWQQLTDLEYKQTWDFVYDKLRFNPRNEKEDLIHIPSPSKYFDIARFYDDGFSEKLYDNLHDSALSWFKKISKGNRMYALNWQHDCFSFAPDLPFEKDEFDEWKIPVFPNGDFLFFLTKNFKNGIFANGINLSLILWGMDIIDALEFETPDILAIQ